MDSLVIEYKDPLFGIIALFVLVFTISFLTYSFGVYKERKARKDYRKLLRRFEIGKLKENDYVHLYKTYNLPFDSILLLASTFLHNGNYTKAISVYLTLLEHITQKVKREELLELLGMTYFKGGFLQRSKDIFLKILKFSPKNIKVLRYLLIIYEKLYEYERLYEVILCLEELGQDVKKDKIFTKSLIILHNSISSYENKTNHLCEIFQKHKSIERLFVQFLIQYNQKFLWDNIEKFNFSKYVDLMWYFDFNDIDFDKVLKNDFLTHLYNAKGYINNLNSSDDFVFNILILLHKQKKEINTNLDFEFMCKTCKHIHPIFAQRCPNCHSILSFDIKYTLAKDLKQRNQSLQ